MPLLPSSLKLPDILILHLTASFIFAYLNVMLHTHMTNSNNIYFSFTCLVQTISVFNFLNITKLNFILETKNRPCLMNVMELYWTFAGVVSL